MVEASARVTVKPEAVTDETVTAVPESETAKAEVAAVVAERVSLYVRTIEVPAEFRTAVEIVGAVAVLGVIELDAEDGLLVPAPLVAVIVNVYAWPSTKDPVTVKGDVVPEYERARDGEEVMV
jgi:hypothetical protein